MNTDTARIDWLITHRAEIEAPYGENNTWVIYTPEKSLGSGAGCGRTLREAIDAAINKLSPRII